MTDLKPQGFVEAVRKVVQTLRYGPRELTLATLGLLLLALPSLLPKEPEFLKPVLSWIPWVGVLLLALAAWLIWRKVVAPVPEGKPKPPAIKGPAPFGPHDAELFARLGRKDDLDRLRSWILDDQKPLVALMGESGVGKTSLLRAGLENHLKEDSVQVIYWEALPTDPEEGLLHAVQSCWKDSSTAPPSFARLASAVARGRRVVVIDQAEQLSPDRHRAIFEMLRNVATANPPYTATWVVTFRREYSSVWRDFELDLPEPAQRRLETLSLRRFLPEQAERVIAVLAEEGGVPIEQKVVKALVESIKSEGRVTPADIGISLLVLSEISGNGQDSAFTVEDFRERGGQAGLLTRYLEGLLEQFPEAERREIFLGLLSLIDLDKDQRLAEGRTPLELEKLARPANPDRFAAALRFLATGKARVLEEVPEPPLRYRLIHERLIPAIRRLTGVLLAAAEQASVLLERAYRIWSRDRKARYLLSGRELRQVFRFREQLSRGEEEDQKREYLLLSRKHHNRLWASSVIVLISMGVAIYLYSEHRSQVASHQAYLSSWALPSDLIAHLHFVEQLTLPRAVTQVDWLKNANRLRHLEIRDGNLASLEGLPEGLRSLKVGTSRLSELPRLPASLVALDIPHMGLKDLTELPQGLLSLGIACTAAHLEKIHHLPGSLEKLKLYLYSTNHPGAEKLSVNLSHMKNLKSVHFLRLGPVTLDRISLPRGVRSIDIDVEMSPAAWRDLLAYLNCPSFFNTGKCSPNTLTSLAIGYPFRNLAPIGVNVPSPPLRSLSVSGESLSQLSSLSGLWNLSIHLEERSSLGQLPPNLKTLKILSSSNADIEISNLPRNLENLEVYAKSARFPRGLPRSLKRLVILRGQTDLAKLPKGLTTLVYFDRLQAPPPASLRSLSIEASDQDLSLLAPLWALSRLRLYGEVTKIPGHLRSLRDLDISDTEIRSLQGLPPDLISLKLKPGQVESLEGLPESVVSLHFIDPLPP